MSEIPESAPVEGATPTGSEAFWKDIDSWTSVTPAKVHEYIDEHGGAVPALTLYAGNDEFWQAVGGDDKLYGVGDKDRVNALINSSDNNRLVFGAIALRDYAGEADRYDGSGFSSVDPKLNDSTIGDADFQRLKDNPDAAAKFNAINAVFDTFKTQADWEKAVGKNAATLQDLQDIDQSKLNSEQKVAIQGAIDSFDYLNSGYTFSDSTIDFDDIQRHRADLRPTALGGNNGPDPIDVADDYEDQQEVKRNAQIQTAVTNAMNDREITFSDKDVMFEVQEQDTMFDLVNTEIRAMNEIAGWKVMEEVQPGADIYNHPFANYLAQNNGITDLDLIYPGQTIKIPKAYLEEYIASQNRSSGPR